MEWSMGAGSKVPARLQNEEMQDGQYLQSDPEAIRGLEDRD